MNKEHVRRYTAKARKREIERAKMLGVLIGMLVIIISFLAGCYTSHHQSQTPLPRTPTEFVERTKIKGVQPIHGMYLMEDLK